jgi:hypothetical protein
MSQVPPHYLTSNIGSLTQQWNTIVTEWNNNVTRHPELNPADVYPSKIDPVSLGGLKREGRIALGGHQYNPSTIINLLQSLSEQPDSISPPVGELGVSLDDFIHSTITPIAASSPRDEDETHIKLYIYDGTAVRLLNQAELNWFFTGSYYPGNIQPIRGLTDPQRGLVSIAELIRIYNFFYKPSQTRSGRVFGSARGGKTIKRKKVLRVNKMSRQRSSKRGSIKSTTRRTRRTRHHRRDDSRCRR